MAEDARSYPQSNQSVRLDPKETLNTPFVLDWRKPFGLHRHEEVSDTGLRLVVADMLAPKLYLSRRHVLRW